jgi:hypothetical protein
LAGFWQIFLIHFVSKIDACHVCDKLSVIFFKNAKRVKLDLKMSVFIKKYQIFVIFGPWSAYFDNYLAFFRHEFACRVEFG